MVTKGQFLGLDWNRIARLHSQVMKGTHMNSLTASRCRIRLDHGGSWVQFPPGARNFFRVFFSIHLHLIS